MSSNQNNQNNQKRSPLESLQEKLYQPGSQISERPEAPEIFQPKEIAPEQVTKEWEEEKIEDYMTVKRIKKKKIQGLLSSAILFLFFGGLAVLGYIYFFGTFRQSDISVKIKGPETVESGESIQFFVSYQNRSDFDLEDAILIFEWPKGSVPRDQGALKIEKRIGNIVSGREASAFFDGQFFGAKNDKLAVNATLKYKPKRKNSFNQGLSDQGKFFESKDVFESIISKTPFSIVMNMPPRAVSGNETELFLEYQNLSETVFSDMQLKLAYPEGFIFSSADPAPSFSDDIWDFDRISGREIGKIKIRGILSGRDNETKLFQAFIGKQDKGQFIAYANSEYSVVMSSTILFVYQTANDARELAVFPGDTLNYKITYRNTSDIAIPNVIVSAKLEGKAVDFKTLNIKWGSFSGQTNSIIWNASGVRQLALLGPGEEGSVSFSVKLNRVLDVSGSSDKNFIVSSIAKVESDQIPESLKGIPIGNEDKVDAKLNTDLAVSVKGVYKSAPIENFGPIPPQLAQKTAYNIIWQLTNSSNDVDNARIEASLPPNVIWEGKINPSDYNISYEQATGKIVWNIGKIPAGTGFVMPAMQAAFQISIVPGIADLGRIIDLMFETNLSAIDLFTNAVISKQAEGKTTYLLEDTYIIENRGWNVAQ